LLKNKSWFQYCWWKWMECFTLSSKYKFGDYCQSNFKQATN